MLRTSAEEPGRTSRRYMLFRWAMNLLGRILFGFTIHGIENVPREGPLIVAANHQHLPDPVFVCMAVPRRVQWMAKKELYVFGLRRFFRFLGTFPVDREGGGRAAVRAGLNFLSEGWALGIFPEGTRGGGQGTRQAKTGVVMLATRAGAPVLPVHIGDVPTPFARLRGKRLEARIGKPVTPDNTLRGREAYREAAGGILSTIYSLADEPVADKRGEKR